jgi:putative redox protein
VHRDRRDAHPAQGAPARDRLRGGARAERAAEDPKIFTAIKLRYIVTGRGLAKAQVERAIKLSKEKYCSATIMLAKTADVTFDFEVREA